MKTINLPNKPAASLKTRYNIVVRESNRILADCWEKYKSTAIHILERHNKENGEERRGVVIDYRAEPPRVIKELDYGTLRTYN